MISACFITLNEEKNIEKVFKHLKGVVDEFVVVDGGSTDNTIDICKKYTDNITIKSLPDFASRRNLAIKKALHQWIFMIDPDERCSKKLLKEIRGLTQGEHEGYKVHWKNYCGSRLVCIPWKTILFKRYAEFGGELHERIINIDDKYKLCDDEIYITHKKTMKEQLKHLTSYRKIILDLNEKTKENDPRLSFLIKDHNENVRAWLGEKYNYLLIEKT